MAGGLGRRGIPLHARSRAAAPALPDPVPPDPGPARHCWVKAPVDAGDPRPGLLLEWRRDDERHWEGRVVYAAQLRPGAWTTVEEWLAADLLSTA